MNSILQAIKVNSGTPFILPSQSLLQSLRSLYQTVPLTKESPLSSPLLHSFLHRDSSHGVFERDALFSSRSSCIFIMRYLFSCFKHDPSIDLKMNLEDVVQQLLYKMCEEMDEDDLEKLILALFRHVAKECNMDGLRLWADCDSIQHIKPGTNTKKFVRKNWVPSMATCLLLDPNNIKALGKVWEKLLPILAFHFQKSDTRAQLSPLYHMIRHPNSQIRRDVAKCISLLCQYAQGDIIVNVFSEIHSLVLSVCSTKRIAYDPKKMNIYMCDQGFKEELECLDWHCLDGCINTFSRLIEKLEIISRKKSKASPVHHSEFNLIASFVLDVLDMSLDCSEKRNILSQSLELLSRLLALYSNNCSQWRKEKVSRVLDKIVALLHHQKLLVVVQPIILEILGRFSAIFVELVLLALDRNNFDINWICQLMKDDDLQVRGNAFIFASQLISAAIENRVDIHNCILFKAGASRHIKAEFDSVESRVILKIEPAEIFQIHCTGKINPNTFLPYGEEPLNLSENLQISSPIVILRHMLNCLFVCLQQEKNPISLRYLCQAFTYCLSSLLLVSELTTEVSHIYYALLQIDDSFWGVRFELLNLVSSLDFSVLEYYERNNRSNYSISELTFQKILWKFISDSNEKVRENACKALVTSLQQLVLDRSKLITTVFTKRSNEFTEKTLKRIISTKTSEHGDLRIYTSEEVSSLIFVLQYIQSNLGEMSKSKDSLYGVTTLLCELTMEYSIYDENTPSLLNYNKGLGVAGEPIYSDFTSEIIYNLLNIARFSPLMADLKLLSQVIQAIGLHTLHLDYSRESKENITRIVLDYYLLVLNYLEAPLNDSPTSLQDIIKSFKSLTVSEVSQELVFSSITRSIRNSSSNQHIKILKENVLRGIYLLQIFGDEQTIVSSFVDVLQHLHTHLKDSQANVILCVQELLATLFERKSNYYRHFIIPQRPPVILNSMQKNALQIYFYSVKEKNLLKQRFQKSHSSLLAPIQSNKKKAKLEYSQILESFETMVILIKETFKKSHDKQLQSVILFMLSRLICIGVNFTRLDKDSSLTFLLLKIIRDMDLSENADFLFYISDLLSLLIFVVSNQLKDVNDNLLMDVMQGGLEKTNWSVPLLLQKLSPLLIRSYSHRQRDTNNEKILNSCGDKLLNVYLNHLSFTETMVSLQLLMEKLPKGSILIRSISSKIITVLVKELQLSVDMNLFKLKEEIGIMFAFLETLDYKAIEDRVNIENYLNTILKNFANSDNRLHQSIQCLIAIKILNLINSSSDHIELYLRCALHCGNFLFDQHDDQDTKTRTLIISYMLLEVQFHIEQGELDKSIVSDSVQDELCTFYTRLINSYSSILENYSNYDYLLMSSIAAILWRLSLHNESLRNIFSSLCLEFINQDSSNHVACIQTNILLLSILQIAGDQRIDYNYLNSILCQKVWSYLCIHKKDTLCQSVISKIQSLVSEQKNSTSTIVPLPGLLSYTTNLLEDGSIVSLRQCIGLLECFPSIPDDILQFLFAYKQKHCNVQSKIKLLNHILPQQPSEDKFSSTLSNVRTRLVQENCSTSMEYDLRILLTEGLIKYQSQMLPSYKSQDMLDFVNVFQSFHYQLLEQIGFCVDEIQDPQCCATLLTWLLKLAYIESPEHIHILGKCIGPLLWKVTHPSEFFEGISHFFSKASNLFLDQNYPFNTHITHPFLILTNHIAHYLLKLVKSSPEFASSEMISKICEIYLTCTYGDSVENNIQQQVEEIINRNFFHIIGEPKLTESIPFISIADTSTLFHIGVKIASLHSQISYEYIIGKGNRDFSTIDIIDIKQLLILFHYIPCNDTLFQYLWSLVFEVFKRVSDMTTIDELQFVSLRLITRMLAKISFNSSKKSTASLATDDSEKSYAKLLHSFFIYFNPFYCSRINSNIDLPDIFDIETGQIESNLGKSDENIIYLDDLYCQAIVDVFLRFISGPAMRTHSENNPQFNLEISKCLCYLMLKNPNLFVIISSARKSPFLMPGSHIESSEFIVGFEQAFHYYLKIYENKLLKDDWLHHQYIMLILVKSSRYLSVDERTKYQNLLMKIMQENLSKKHTRMAGYFAMHIVINHRDHGLISKMLTYISQNIMKWFQDAETDNDILFIMEITSELVKLTPVECSMHQINKRYIEELFKIANTTSNSPLVLKSAYKKLTELLENYSLSHEERSLIEKSSLLHNEGQVPMKTNLTKEERRGLFSWKRVDKDDIKDKSMEKDYEGTPKKKRWFTRNSQAQKEMSISSETHSKKTTSSISTQKGLKTLRNELLPQSLHPQLQRILKYYLMLVNIYTGEKGNKQNVNILDIFQPYRAQKENREAELLVSFIPQALIDHAEPHDILSMYMSDLLHVQYNPKLLGLIIRRFFQKQIREKLNNNVNSLDQYLQLAISTLAIEKSIVPKLWILKCLYVACLGIDAYFTYLLHNIPKGEETELSETFITNFCFLTQWFMKFCEKRSLNFAKEVLVHTLKRMENESEVCHLCNQWLQL